MRNLIKIIYKMRRTKLKYVLFCACSIIFLCYIFGVKDYLYARSYDKDFDYPVNIDIRSAVEDILAGRNRIKTEAINLYPYGYRSPGLTCDPHERLDLFISVKSARHHFGHRRAIRQTYGQKNYLNGRKVKIAFFLGIDESNTEDAAVQRGIDEEIKAYGDIVLIAFHDDYYNNTIKTIMSFKWLINYCLTAEYYLFNDDDMYINVHKLLSYLEERKLPSEKNIREYPKSIIQNIVHMSLKSTDVDHEATYAPLSEETRESELLLGYVFKSLPQRYWWSKWRVSLEEYPWDKWPPYVTAGAYVVSHRALIVLYVGSVMVKHFRFDDIYLGIVAKKVGIAPTHCPHIYFYKKMYSREGYRDVIASHGYSDHDELVKVWNEQNNDRI